MRRNPRAGLTLTEVLVAMFVMALGLMALATLFPLGALQIGQALKDDRTGQVSMLADGWMRVYWRDVARPLVDPTSPEPLPGDPLLATFDDANVAGVGLAQSAAVTGPPTSYIYSTVYSAPVSGGSPVLLPRPTTNQLSTVPATPTPTSFTTIPTGLRVTDSLTPDNRLPNQTTPMATLDGTFQRFVTRGGRPATRPATPSYPVLVDPLGWLSRSGTAAIGFERHWVGRASAPGAGGAVYGLAPAETPLLIPRRNTAVTGNLATAYPAFALTDDLTYQPNGGSGQTTTDPSTGAATPQPLGRQGRYTWAALIQRPDNSLGHKASLKVLVFDGRPVGFAAAGDEVVLMNDPASAVRFHRGGGTGGEIVAGDRSLTLLLPTRGADQAPLLRRGGWVMLAVTEPATVSATAGFPTPRAGVRKVSFHRVTGLTADDDVLSGQPNPLTGAPAVQYNGGPQLGVTPVAIDIDPPVPAEFAPVSPTTAPPLATQVILLAGLSEVFDRPDLDASN